MTQPAIEVISTEHVYSGKIVDLDVEQVRLPDHLVDRLRQEPLHHARQPPRRAVAICLRALEHGVLDDVDRGVLVADRVHRLLERPAFDLGLLKSKKLRRLSRVSLRPYPSVPSVT